MLNLFHLYSYIIGFLLFPVAPQPEPFGFADHIFHPGPKESSDYIAWKYERPLTWEDFLCEPLRNTDAVASTSTSLGISYKITNGKFIYDLDCSFSKSRSWGLLKTSYILAHEQGHFDITEIYTRKLHQRLQQYQFNRKTFKHDLTVIYEKIVKEKEAFQNRYDTETSHSRLKGKQNEWLDKIDLMLEETEAYANYP